MAADGHLGMMALSRVTLASAGLSCLFHEGGRSGQFYETAQHSIAYHSGCNGLKAMSSMPTS